MRRFYHDTEGESFARKEETLMTALDNLTAKVHRIESTADSAEAMLTNLSGILRATSNDVAVQALADELDAKATQLAAAVANSDPSAPLPAPVATAIAGTGLPDAGPAAIAPPAAPVAARKAAKKEAAKKEDDDTPPSE